MEGSLIFTFKIFLSKWIKKYVALRWVSGLGLINIIYISGFQSLSVPLSQAGLGSQSLTIYLPACAPLPGRSRVSVSDHLPACLCI